MFEQAILNATAKAKADNEQVLNEAIETLSASFDETVRRLIVPVTVKVDRGNGTEPVLMEGIVHSAFQECLTILSAGCNLMLVGPTGCGKTTLGEQLAKALDVGFRLTGQVISEHQVTGFVDAGGSYHPTSFYDAHVNGSLWLGDEMDSWSPEATLSANAALANGYATFPNSPEPVTAHSDRFIVGTMNTWGSGADSEHVGRNEMDKASLSRYVTLPMDYDKALETQLAGDYQEWLHIVWKVRDKSRELRKQMFAGTREIVHGVKLLNVGMEQGRVIDLVLRRNLSSADWDKVSA
jgi:MoxR-like ATPase